MKFCFIFRWENSFFHLFMMEKFGNAENWKQNIQFDSFVLFNSLLLLFFRQCSHFAANCFFGFLITDMLTNGKQNGKQPQKWRLIEKRGALTQQASQNMQCVRKHYIRRMEENNSVVRVKSKHAFSIFASKITRTSRSQSSHSYQNRLPITTTQAAARRTTTTAKIELNMCQPNERRMALQQQRINQFDKTCRQRESTEHKEKE